MGKSLNLIFFSSFDQLRSRNGYSIAQSIWPIPGIYSTDFLAKDRTVYSNSTCSCTLESEEVNSVIIACLHEVNMPDVLIWHMHDCNNKGMLQLPCFHGSYCKTVHVQHLACWPHAKCYNDRVNLFWLQCATACTVAVDCTILCQEVSWVYSRDWSNALGYGVPISGS